MPARRCLPALDDVPPHMVARPSSCGWWCYFGTAHLCVKHLESKQGQAIRQTHIVPKEHQEAVCPLDPSRQSSAIAYRDRRHRLPSAYYSLCVERIDRNRIPGKTSSLTALLTAVTVTVWQQRSAADQGVYFGTTPRCAVSGHITALALTSALPRNTVPAHAIGIYF